MTPEEFWHILHSVPEPRPIFYRLYHDDLGRPLFYSMEDLPGNYIELDRETYARGSSRVRVKDGKLIEISAPIQQKLCPAEDGISCHVNDITIVTDQEPRLFWKLREPD